MIEISHVDMTSEKRKTYANDKGMHTIQNLEETLATKGKENSSRLEKTHLESVKMSINLGSEIFKCLLSIHANIDLLVTRGGPRMKW